MLSLLVTSLVMAAPVPAGLPTSKRFFVSSELESFRDDSFDPEEWINGSPRELTFDASGKVTLFWGQDGDSCQFTAGATDGGTTDLALSCEDGMRLTAQWRWVDARRAMTNLLDVGPRDTSQPPLREVTEVAAGSEPDYRAAAERFDVRYAAGHLPALVGDYASPDGKHLRVQANGQVLVDGVSTGAKLLRCTLEQGGPIVWPKAFADAGDHAPCLIWPAGTDGGRQRRTLLAVTGAAGPSFLEVASGTDIAYWPVEPVPTERIFVRTSGGTPSH
jgi:hypothetical protein